MKYFTLMFLIVLIGSVWATSVTKDMDQNRSNQIPSGVESPEQALYFFDSFEAYIPATPLCVQTNNWTPWGGVPGAADDPLVSNAQAYSGSNSVVILQNDDLVWDIGTPVTTGTWSLSWQMYIPSGKAGYFNTLTTFGVGGVGAEWAMQAYFNVGGTGTLDAGGTSAATFTYAYDTWMPVVVLIDLDNDVAEFWLDGAMIYTWQYTLGTFGTPVQKQFDANDFFGATASDEMYIDDYTIEEIVPDLLFSDNFDGYAAGYQLALQNPIFWTTWSNAPGGGEDPMVSNAYANSDSNSVVITQNNDLVKTFGSLTTGKYYIDFMVYIPNGKAGYFNTLAVFSPPSTFDWGMEVYFDVGGGGRLIGVPTPPTFSYDYDTWQSVEVVVDLDNDLAEFWFEGAMIHSWQWTQGGTVTHQLDANDFFGATANDEMYFDDYSIRAESGPPVLDPPTNLVAEAGDGVVDLSWVSPLGGGGGTELAYDDGVAEGNLSIGSTAEGDLAVRFTPNVYPSTILAIKVHFAVVAGAMTSADWTIWDGTSTGPGTSLATGNHAINRGAFDEVDVSGSAVQITADDFFISYFEPNGQTINLSWDTTQPSANRSWVNAPTLGFPWQTLAATGIGGFDNNLMIRAIVMEGSGPNARMVELSPNGASRVLSAAEVKGLSLESQAQTGSISTGAVCLDGTQLPNVDTYFLPVSQPNGPESIKNLNGFNIYRSLDGTSFSMLANVDSATVSYTDNAVTNGTTYWYYVTAVYDEGESASTDTVEATPMVVGIGDLPGVPKEFALNQNYPNPFNPTTTIKYQLPRISQVTIAIYNLVGQKVKTLVNSTIEPGYYEVTWNGLNDAGVQVGSGIYFYRFQSDEFVSIKKMMFLK